MRIRRAEDRDSDGVIALVAAVFAEYPGCVLDVDAEEPELRTPGTGFERFWVLEDDAGAVAGCIGLDSREAGGSPVVTLKKLYVRADLRRGGWGSRLVGRVEDHARQSGAAGIELWSDTRFAAAHAFYRARGYRRTGRVRELHDLSRTTEHHYRKDLREPRGPPPPAG